MESDIQKQNYFDNRSHNVMVLGKGQDELRQER